MGLRRKAPVAIEAPKVVTGSAMRLTSLNMSMPRYNMLDETWQREAWRTYNCGGELHFAADYVGSACSLVRLTIRHVDEYGVMQGEVDDDPEVGAIAHNLFGGPAQKAAIFKQMGASFTVAGDMWLIGRTDDENPGMGKWVVVAPYNGKPYGDRFIIDMGSGRRISVIPNVDAVVVRMKQDHPEAPDCADSPTRALLNTFGQLERLRLFLNSQLNSRLAWASLLPWPMLDFPQDDSDASAGESVMQKLYEIMLANLTGEGTGGALAPILAEMPLEFLQAMRDIKPITFDSPLAQEAIELRKELRTEISEGLNIPATFFDGGRNTNHWAAWWGSEEFATKSVAPIFCEITAGLNTAVLFPGLQSLGKDPSRYTFWYDLSPLFNSADQLTDALNLGERGYISDETVRAAGNYNGSNIPSEEERTRKYLRELTLRDPTLFQSPAVRELLGIDIPELLPALSTPPPPPPAPQRGMLPAPVGSKPDRESSQVATTDDESLSASSMVSCSSPLLAASNVLVIRALELAGNRLVGQKHRNLFPGTKSKDYHTKLKVSDHDHASRLLNTAWDYADDAFDGISVQASTLVPLLDQYTHGLLVSSLAHSPGLLSKFLEGHGVR